MLNATFNSRVQQLISTKSIDLYYSALGDDDQVLPSPFNSSLAPGIPQKVYCWFLAVEWFGNSLEKHLKKPISTAYYSNEEIAQEVERPVVQSLLKLLVSGTTRKLLDLEGSIEVETPDDHTIAVITRQNRDQTVTAVARIDLADGTY